MNYLQGLFSPKNPQKYKGNPNNIIFRSGWELKFMQHLDRNPNVIFWANEEFYVTYISPEDNRAHRYFPDFWVQRKTNDGTIRTTVYEIKPDVQTKPPVQGKKRNKTYINEVLTYGKNQAKWKAAEIFCKNHGWDFQVITENHLGIKRPNGNKRRKR